MSNKHKQTALELQDKISIINDIKAGKKQTVVAATLNLSRKTINSIWQNREKIRQAYEASGNNKRKRLRTAAFDDVEEAVLKWFKFVRSENIPLKIF